MLYSFTPLTRWSLFFLLLLLHGVVLPLTVHGQTGPFSPEDCRKKIDSLFSTQQGTFALAFKDLSSGKELYIREQETFHAASTMKTPVLIEIYRQAAEGRFSLSDSLTLNNDFASIADTSHFRLKPDDDSELDLYRHPGEKRSISQLVYLMITVSSNFATNLLIDKVGAGSITRTLHALGADDLHVVRGVEDQKAYDLGMNNTVTAHGLLVLFGKLAMGEVVSRAASDSMIRILLDQHFNEIIPAGLPPGLRVAHKTGWITGINHDGGIVYLPDGGKYVLVLLSKDTQDDKGAISMMAAVSNLIYRYVMQ